MQALSKSILKALMAKKYRKDALPKLYENGKIVNHMTNSDMMSALDVLNNIDDISQAISELQKVQAELETFITVYICKEK